MPVILICLHCAASFRVRRDDRPELCPRCLCRSGWRVAAERELTRADLKFLRGLRIVPEW